MTYVEYTKKLDAIKEMAEHKSTGAPKNFATRLEVSERTLQRMVHLLRDTGYPIYFDRNRNTYVKKEL